MKIRMNLETKGSPNFYETHVAYIPTSEVNFIFQWNTLRAEIQNFQALFPLTDEQIIPLTYEVLP